MGAEHAQPNATFITAAKALAAPSRTADDAFASGMSNRAFSAEIGFFAAPGESQDACEDYAAEDQQTVEETGSSWLTEETKDTFLAELRAAVCATTDEGMAGTGSTSAGCPYIDYWFAEYATRTAAQLRVAARRFAPEIERVSERNQVVRLLAARVRRSVDQWAATGEITGLPDGVPAITGGGMPGGVFFRARTGIARSAPNPVAVRAQLGRGRPLTGAVRDRMEPAFGVSFERVRLHDDPAAAALASRLDARAFAVGEHVAFAGGEYRPGTPAGDALLAHELAHVVQQGEGAPGRAGAGGAVEADADRAAAGVLNRLWLGTGGFARAAVPQVRTGLQLHRCGASQHPPTAQAASDQCPILPAATPSRGGSNAVDAKGAGIIAIAQDQSRPLSQRGIQVVRAIICTYFPNDLSKVSDVVFEQPNAEAPTGHFDGIITTSVGSGPGTTGILDVSRTVVENVPTHLAHEVLRVRHELDHIDQFRAGLAGARNKHEREFLAHYAEAMNPELPGTGRLSAPTRIRVIDAALGHYYCLPAQKQTGYAERRDSLLARRTQEQGRIRNRAQHPLTDPPTSCSTGGTP